MTPFNEVVRKALVFLLRRVATQLVDHRDSRECECEACALRRAIDLEACT